MKTYFEPTLQQEREFKARKERVKKFYESNRLKGITLHPMKHEI
ncbi:MAG: hypothetical protein AABY22_11820 [Nanoarchaeota archaeon]